MNTIHLLKTFGMPDVPADVKLLDDGTVMTRTSSGDGIGNHIAVEASPEAIRAWLGDLDGFWLGIGAPFMQQFEIYHVQETGDGILLREKLD